MYKNTGKTFKSLSIKDSLDNNHEQNKERRIKLRKKRKVLDFSKNNTSKEIHEEMEKIYEEWNACCEIIKKDSIDIKFSLEHKSEHDLTFFWNFITNITKLCSEINSRYIIYFLKKTKILDFIIYLL